MEKKIFLEKNDGLEVAVEELIRSKSDAVTLNIPKDSVLGKSVNNFHVLKREGATAGKTLMIESVDDHILEIASHAMITAINPVFNKAERSVSDILPRAGVLLKKQKKDEEDDSQEEKSEKHFFEHTKREMVGGRHEAFFHEENDEKPKKRRTKSHRGVFSIVSIAVVLCVSLFVFLYWFVLPRATVVLTLKQKSIQFNIPIEISQNNAETKAGSSRLFIKGQLAVSQGNLSGSIALPSASSTSGARAEGVITIFNEYGATPQKLIATTRFESPDGKIFRLKNDIIVPGGKTIKGVFKPGMIDAAVIADAIGEEYNIAPANKFTIPGFKETPRFNKFYASSKDAMSGGMNEVAITAPSDLNNSQIETEESIIEKLKTALHEKMRILDSAKLKVLDDARQFVITKRDLQNGSDGTVLYVEGALKEIGFQEGDISDAIREYYKDEVGEKMRIRSINFSYETSTPNFATGAISSAIQGSVVFEADVDVEMVINSILGRKISDASSYLLSVSGVESATINPSPKWGINTVPNNRQKIDLQVR